MPGQAHFILSERWVKTNFTLKVRWDVEVDDLKNVIYTEGTPGLAHFTLRVRQVRRILYWGCARSDEVYTEGMPGFANFTLRVGQVSEAPKVPQNDVWILQMDKILKKSNDSYRGDLSQQIQKQFFLP
jgi:hypothetical protein